MSIIITPELLQKILPQSGAQAIVFAPYLTKYMPQYGIDTPLRAAMFLAQIGHESCQLRYTTELWGPTPEQQQYWHNSSIGNHLPGDGELFRGRGLIQITGRSNYAACGVGIGLELVSDPILLSEPAPATESATWWWKSHNLNKFADVGDIERCTKVINGGLNGLAAREAFYTAAKITLSC